MIGGMVRLVLPVLHNKQHEHSAMYSGRKEGGFYFYVIVYNINYSIGLLYFGWKVTEG